MSAEALARIDAALSEVFRNAALSEFERVDPEETYESLVSKANALASALRGARAEIVRQSALIPEPPAVASVEEWSAAMDAERQRQVEHGYDDAHDRAHGPAHLLNWAIDYARRGRVLEAATMVRSALHVLSAEPPTDDEREARPTIDLAREIASWDQGVEETGRIPHWAANLAMHLREKGYRHHGPITDEEVTRITLATAEHGAFLQEWAVRAVLEAAQESAE